MSSRELDRVAAQHPNILPGEPAWAFHHNVIADAKSSRFGESPLNPLDLGYLPTGGATARHYISERLDRFEPLPSSRYNCWHQ
jgi:hypothetical protein